MLPVPIIQGGMGVGVSLGGLAGAVAACGGMGCISTADVGYQEIDFDTAPQAANLRALGQEIAKAKATANGMGLVAVNAMVATRQYADSVRAAVAAGVDAVISGAGLPLDLPALVAGSNVSIAPIVSSARAAKLICTTWEKRFARLPDFIVIEGCEAGGHLGFAEGDVLSGTCAPLATILQEVRVVAQSFEQKCNRAIPVFVAGGVYTAQDIQHFLAQGAAGVQMATRFIATYECDASQAYKDILRNATPADVRIVHSPVGMPGRALNTPLVQTLAAGGRIPPAKCSACVKTCKPQSAQYCITHALIQAVKGNVQEGLFFCGSSVPHLGKMQSVAALMQELKVAFIKPEIKR